MCLCFVLILIICILIRLCGRPPTITRGTYIHVHTDSAIYKRLYKLIVLRLSTNSVCAHKQMLFTCVCVRLSSV